jgi:integrase
MIRQGADAKLIQARLGHSSISVTHDIHGHLFPDRLDDLASRLDELIQRIERSRTRDRDIGRSL